MDFAEVTEFIDTPVKRHSSGVNARLGFSIAAHLDSDVLIIDEVLAVGDFAFQQRAFGRIQEVVSEDIPVVVVSHQLDRIATLCSKAMLLQRGCVLLQGKPLKCISRYVSGSLERSGGPDDCSLQLHQLRIVSGAAVPSGSVLTYELTGALDDRPESGQFAAAVRVRSTQTGKVVFATDSEKCGVTLKPGAPFELQGMLQFNVPAGVYAVETVLWNRFKNVGEGSGPSAYVQVTEGLLFWGTNQMNAQMQFAASALPTA